MTRLGIDWGPAPRRGRAGSLLVGRRVPRRGGDVTSRRSLDRARQPARPAKGHRIASALTMGAVGIWVLVVLGANLSRLAGEGRASDPVSSGQPAGRTPAAVSRSGRCLNTAWSWIDGLDRGVILPEDVPLRLGRRQPARAAVVLTAWADLNRTAYWHGHAAGRIFARREVEAVCTDAMVGFDGPTGRKEVHP